MHTRRVGRSGLQVPVITLGLMVRDCSPGAPFESVRATLRRAAELGVTSIDLAAGYGGGSVERAVGRILRDDFAASDDSTGREKFVLATKGGWGDGSRRALIASLERSLRQLGVEHVDLFYHHAPDPHTPPEETLAALDQLVRQGKTRYVGISNYSAAQTVRLGALMRQAGVPCVMHQANYHLLNRWVEDGLLAALEGLEMGLAVFAAVAQGLLSDAAARQVRPGSRAAATLEAIAAGVPAGETAYGLYPRDVDVRAHVLAMVRALAEFAHARGATLSQLALAWALRHAEVATVLVGCSSPAQVEEAAAAATLQLAQDELLAIRDIIPPRGGML